MKHFSDSKTTKSFAKRNIHKLINIYRRNDSHTYILKELEQSTVKVIGQKVTGYFKPLLSID